MTGAHIALAALVWGVIALALGLAGQLMRDGYVIGFAGIMAANAIVLAVLSLRDR